MSTIYASVHVNSETLLAARWETDEMGQRYLVANIGDLTLFIDHAYVERFRQVLAVESGEPLRQS